MCHKNNAIVIGIYIIQSCNYNYTCTYLRGVQMSSCNWQIMKRNRFSLVLRFLHLNDSTQYIRKGEPGHDPLFKLRPFIEPLFRCFQASYTLSKEICVDESIIGYKGRQNFIQYMPKKPTKWGMKAYILADSQTGYLYNWYLYSGECIIHLCFLFVFTFFSAYHWYGSESHTLTYMHVPPYTRRVGRPQKNTYVHVNTYEAHNHVYMYITFYNKCIHNTYTLNLH